MIKAEKIDESLELYEFAAEKCDTRLPSAAARNSIAVNAYVNLGVIYAGTSRYAKALEVLNKASLIVLDTKTKAEILYRMAKLSDGLGDRRNALRQIEYALELDPAHKKARLFFKTL